MANYTGILTGEELRKFQADFLELAVCVGTIVTTNPVPAKLHMLAFSITLEPKNVAMDRLLEETLNHDLLSQSPWPKKFTKVEG